MTEPSTGRTAGFALALLGLWLVPSLGQLVKYTGLAGASGLAVIALLGLWAMLAAADRGWLRPTTAWFVALCVLAVALFAVLYPLAQGGRLGGGSDRDEALNDALRLLVSGDYPYAVATYLGNPPTPMPGALLLALPFHAMGNAAYQNLLWVPAFLLWCRRPCATAACAWIAGVVIVFAGPQALDDFVVGGDYLVNAIYVAIATDWCVRAHRGGHGWWPVASTIAMTIAVSSRPIYAVALVVMAGHLWQAHGPVRSAHFVALAGVAVLAVNLPFYLYDPARFPTAHLLGKLDGQPGAAFAKVALPALGMLVAGAAFRWRLAASRPLDLLALSLGVMLYPPFVLEALGGVPLGRWMWTATFSLPVTVLGTLAVLQRFERRRPSVSAALS